VTWPDAPTCVRLGQALAGHPAWSSKPHKTGQICGLFGHLAQTPPYSDIPAAGCSSRLVRRPRLRGIGRSAIVRRSAKPLGLGLDQASQPLIPLASAICSAAGPPDGPSSAPATPTCSGIAAFGSQFENRAGTQSQGVLSPTTAINPDAGLSMPSPDSLRRLQQRMASKERPDPAEERP
jgi:hypothetical protein